MITLTGTVGTWMAVIVFLCYDTSCREVLPLWTYFFMGFAVFMYQTLDAVDGKQARRTGTSGPLGQLFDHGCDAMATPILSLFFMQGMMLGDQGERDLTCLFFVFISSSVSEIILFSTVRVSDSLACGVDSVSSTWRNGRSNTPTSSEATSLGF